LKGDKAVSVQDLKNQVSLSYLYQLPFGHGRKWANQSKALDLLVGGWEVGAIQRYSSGQPIDFGCATGIPYYQNCITFTAGPASNGATSFASAAYKSGKNGPSVFNGESWFKPAYRVPGTNGGSDPGVPMAQAAFVDQNREGVGWARPYTPGCGTPNAPCSFTPFGFGNIARVTEAITGPMYQAEDVSLMKDFHIREKMTFQLKGEAFDLLNRHRMALPDLSPTDSSQSTGFGIPTAVDYGPRNLQVSGRFNFYPPTGERRQPVLPPLILMTNSRSFEGYRLSRLRKKLIRAIGRGFIPGTTSIRSMPASAAEVCSSPFPLQIQTVSAAFSVPAKALTAANLPCRPSSPSRRDARK
jgi:hypothetical protein